MQQEAFNEAQIKLTKANIQQYRDALKNLGMGDPQLDELAKTRSTPRKSSSGAGNRFVLARNVTPASVMKGKGTLQVRGHQPCLGSRGRVRERGTVPKTRVTAKVSVPNINRTFYAK
jgi:hypothetical protein